MLYLYRYFKGFLEISVTGERNEIFLNIAAKNGITIWNTHLVGKTIKTNILIDDFRKLRKLLRKKGIRIHILARKGLPFKTEKNKKRLGFYVGFILSLIFLEIMSGYIWVIDINGNDKISDEEILSALSSIGIKEGIKISDINPKRDRERLILLSNEMSWSSLNIEGSRLTVNIREIDKNEDAKTATNLKAESDGIIKRIDVTIGNCIVKPGDIVRKGDLLVSGIVEKGNETVFTKSKGEIIAEISEDYTFYKPYKKTEMLSTGKVKEKSVLEIFGIKIPLYLSRETDTYTSSTATRQLELSGNKIPIKIHTKEFHYTQEHIAIYQKEDLYTLLENEFENKLKTEKIESYTIKKKEFIETDGGISLRTTIVFEKNIAVSEKMLTNQSAE